MCRRCSRILQDEHGWATCLKATQGNVTRYSRRSAYNMISWQTKAQGPWSTNIMVLLQRKHSWILATWLFRKMVSSLSRTPSDLVTQFWRFTFCIILISHFKSSHARPLDFCKQVRMPFFGTTFSSSFCKHVQTCPNMSHKSFTGFTCHWTCRIRSQECFGISWELALEKDWSFALCHVTIFHPCALQGPLGPYRGPTETTCAQLISNLI
jgi:hypothetical protein